MDELTDSELLAKQEKKREYFRQYMRDYKAKKYAEDPEKIRRANRTARQRR